MCLRIRSKAIKHTWDDDAVRGYFFVSFLALYNYYILMNRLREKEPLEEISVRELLLEGLCSN